MFHLHTHNIRSFVVTLNVPKRKLENFMKRDTKAEE
jgi:hypothetical protein